MSSRPGTVRRWRETRHYREPSRLARYVAPQLGLKPASVEQLIHGHTPIQTRFWRLVEAALKLGDERILSTLMARGEAILAQVRAVDPVQAELAETDEDAAEDQLQARYRYARSPDERRAIARERVQGIDRLRRRLLELREALIRDNQLDDLGRSA